MSFDAFMTRAVTDELSRLIVGARVEKVLQPTKDEIFLALHKETRHFKLQFSASAATPRIGITEESPENPLIPPMFCMLLRKHLTGARISAVSQHGLERAVAVSFETYDEMGFFTARHLICEIMGRCSNIILCADADGETEENGEKSAFERRLRILSCAKTVDFTTSSKRQLLPGMLYELPPAQDKLDPFTVTEKTFLAKLSYSELTRSEFLTSNFLGFSPQLSRELEYRATGCDDAAFYREFLEIT